MADTRLTHCVVISASTEENLRHQLENMSADTLRLLATMTVDVLAARVVTDTPGAPAGLGGQAAVGEGDFSMLGSGLTEINVASEFTD